MAEQEEDVSSLPLPDRFAHKNWKVRKDAYEAAAKEFDSAQTESDPSVRQFLQDPNLWKGAVTDANAAAHQEALAALCSFLQIAGTPGCNRTRGYTITPLAEKGLPSTKPAAKQKALEAILLYVELDKPDPVVDELLPLLSHKTPKVVAAVLSALTAVVHEYGCKTVDPKPVVKTLPKAFGHADKNVRAEAQNLTVELYRWLRDSMKPLFWEELKPVQQQDLEKLFEKVREEAAPKPQRLLRSQQAAAAVAATNAADATDGDAAAEAEDEGEEDFEPELMTVNVFPKIPKDLQDRLASTKWKDRKDALDELHNAVNAPAIEEGPFDDIVRALAKCMKDANIAVVTVAANCVELLATGLKRSFAKYRSTIFGPMMERLKERKQTVTDALGGALDAVGASVNLSDHLEETVEFLKHKNPLVKLEATRFLVRNLKVTKEAPSIPETKLIAETATKLLADSQETQRSAAAEVFGVLLKIMGERIMNTHLEGLDDIRKAKIKEFSEAAEVKAKYKPKAVAPPPKPAGPPGAAQKKPVTKKPASATTPAAAKKPAAPAEEPPATGSLQPKPTARTGVPKPGTTAAPRGLKPPTAGSAAKKLAQPSPTPASPQRPAQPAAVDEDQASAPKGRGLTGRPLGKVFAPAPEEQPASNSSTTAQLPSIERIELDELRSEVERLRSTNETLRSETMKLSSQVHELQNQNAQLIEDHTRDVLSIKAKETQLVRARTDAETAEQTSAQLTREVERMKRELARMGRATSPKATDFGAQDIFRESSLSGNRSAYPTSGSGGNVAGVPNRNSMASPTGSSSMREGKENAAVGVEKVLSPRSADLSRPPTGSPTRQPQFNTTNTSRPASRPGAITSQPAAPLGRTNSTSNSNGVMSDGEARASGSSTSSAADGARGRDSGGAANGGSGVESWRRAAEVTQNLKARIELMKAKQGMSRG